jgi:uncharacterized membrane protein YecN with MAPEG domain
MSVPITGFYAGLLAVLLLVLAARVSLLRSKRGVGIGHGNDPELARAIRVNGNAAEWIPPMLVLLLVAELDGANRSFLHVCGALFVLSRLAHAAGLARTSKSSSARYWGMAGSWLVIALLAGWNIIAFARIALRHWR